MGSVVSAKQLKDALSQAQNVGIVEESFVLHELPMVVQSLRPDQHEAILAECEGLDDLPYLHAYQKAHVARALIEVAGHDLRSVEFIEDEVQDEKGRPKKTRMERHAWVTANILNTWGREAIYTAYRKVNDALEKAEKKAQQGITFLMPDETDEEKARRLLSEAKDVLGSLAPLVRRRTLDDYGLIEQSTAEEIKAAQETLDQVAREQEGLSEDPMEEAPETDPHPEPVLDHTDVAELRRGLQQVAAVPPVRPPLNRTVDIGEVGTRIAPQAPPSAPLTGRAAELAAQHAQMEQELGYLAPPPVSSAGAPPIPTDLARPEPTEIRERPSLDPHLLAREAASIIDTPPPAGINPRFRPTRR